MIRNDLRESRKTVKSVIYLERLTCIISVEAMVKPCTELVLCSHVYSNIIYMCINIWHIAGYST